MTVIYLAKYNTKCYAVTYKNNRCVKVQKLEDDSFDKSIIYETKPRKIFLGKNEACSMTAI